VHSLRILHVIPGFTLERGGPPTVVHALARAQANAGHRVEVLCTNQGSRHGEQQLTLPEHIRLRLVNVLGPDRLAFAPRFTEVCRDALRTTDVMHVHSIFTYPIHIALREALARKVPIVVRPCGLLHRYSLRRSAWQKWAYLRLWGKRARRACTLWHYTSSQEAAGSWPSDDSPRFVLPNGIDPCEFDVNRDQARREVEQKWPLLAGSPYVLFLSRLHPKKRLDLLLEAFLRSAPPAFKLVVAGPDESSLWAGLEARFLRDPTSLRRIVRIPPVRDADKVHLFAGASLFAMPSEHENFGIAALEALACGTPILLSPHVDLSEDVAATGWATIAPLDPGIWADRLSSLSPEPNQADAIRDWVATNYSWEKLQRSLERHYNRIVGNSRS
jgi:glycosyltransferase involved in cell wall biosynthesis